MDYVTGAKIDGLMEVMTEIRDMIQYDLSRKYPELQKKPKSDTKRVG